MTEALRDIAFRELKRDFAALEKPTKLAKVPNAKRNLFKNLIIEAVLAAWYADHNLREREGPLLRQVIRLAENFRSKLIAPPGVLLEHEGLFDRLLSDYANIIEEFLYVAAHVGATIEERERRPRGGQRRSGSNRSRFEAFAESVYRAALRSGGKLTVNKNATRDDNLGKGSFAEVLVLLRPYLPPQLIPKGLSMGLLHRIKFQVDDEYRHVS
jgi:hypothetical protein